MKNFSLFINIINSITFLVFPFLFLIIYFRKKINKIFFIILFLFSVLFIYVRFIETRIIIERQTNIQTGFNSKIILISDTHLGENKTEKFLERVVKKINKIDGVDYVLIAGDFTYNPEKKDIPRLFAPLKDVKYPLYAVLGNHDVQKPGPKLREELVNYLESINIKVLNNEIMTLDKFTLAGLGDRWNGEDNVNILNTLSSTTLKNAVVLAHNPETTLDYKNIFPALTLSGHTHCGQVRIPFIYKAILPNEERFDKGLSDVGPNSQLYITCGLGEVILPIRFLNPPVVDIIDTY